GRPARRRAAIGRRASWVSARGMTQNVISPGLKVATPTVWLISSQCGGRIEETVTRFCCSMSASRSAYSNAVSAWRCTPTPRVRNTDLGNGNIGIRNSLLVLHATLHAGCNAQVSFVGEFGEKAGKWRVRVQ